MIRLLGPVALLGLSLVFVGPALGQVPQGGSPNVPQTGPTVSPYLNLLRRGNSAGVNYYGIVRPQMDFRNSLRSQQQATNAGLQALAAANDPMTGLPVSGHIAVFQNTGGYFLNSYGGMVPGSMSGPPRPANAGNRLGAAGAIKPPRTR